MSSGTNSERITQNNGIITENNADLDSLKTRIQNLPTRAVTQTKSVTITENGTTTVEPDEGYDGLSEVEINVENDYNTKIENIFRSSNFKADVVRHIKKIPDISITYNTNNMYLNNMFYNFSSLLEAPMVTSVIPIKSTASMFNSCWEIKEAKPIDLSSCTDCAAMYMSCSSLEDVPIYDLSSATNLKNMYYSCMSLTNDSLNNILYSLAHATAYINQGTNMTLAYIGLTQEQATTCQTLSNWDAFVNAGWTSGY